MLASAEWNGHIPRINHSSWGTRTGTQLRPGDTATEQIYWADTASTSDGQNIHGDGTMTYDNFYSGPWLNGYQVIVV